MATAAVLANGRDVAAAWQAAPAVQSNGKVRYAVEGLAAQKILWAASRDGGATWGMAHEARCSPNSKPLNLNPKP